jgi:hypothetical protein
MLSALPSKTPSVSPSKTPSLSCLSSLTIAQRAYHEIAHIPRLIARLQRLTALALARCNSQNTTPCEHPLRSPPSLPTPSALASLKIVKPANIAASSRQPPSWHLPSLPPLQHLVKPANIAARPARQRCGIINPPNVAASSKPANVCGISKARQRLRHLQSPPT